MQIADIGKTRLEKVLFKDKTVHPEKLCEVLESDIKNLVENYVDLESKVDVTLVADENGFLFEIKFTANRLKPFGCLPERF